MCQHTINAILSGVCILYYHIRKNKDVHNYAGMGCGHVCILYYHIRGNKDVHNYAGMGCGLGWTPAPIPVTHSVAEATYIIRRYVSAELFLAAVWYTAPLSAQGIFCHTKCRGISAPAPSTCPTSPLAAANAQPVFCPWCSTVYTYCILTGGKSGPWSVPFDPTTMPL